MNESYTSRLNKMESLISYSKITLTLTETFSASQIKGQPVSFGERLADDSTEALTASGTAFRRLRYGSLEILWKLYCTLR